MINYFPPLQPDTFYHIYNRGNNGELIFFKPDNYRYFLKKLGQYVSNYIDIYAYCLLPNHFHLLTKVKASTDLKEHLKQIQSGRGVITELSKIISEEFRRFFLSYAKSIKVQEGRTGSLFEKNFKRIEVMNDKHLIWLINYIHRNPETHRLIDDFRNYPHSSYESILSNAFTQLKRVEVLNLFAGREDFIAYHLTNPILNDTKLVLE